MLKTCTQYLQYTVSSSSFTSASVLDVVHRKEKIIFKNEVSAYGSHSRHVQQHLIL